MAAVNTETGYTYTSAGGGNANSPGGLTKVSGTFVTSGGTTTGVVCPGYQANGADVLLTPTRGIRTINNWGFTNNVSSGAFKVVKTYDATADADILTVTCTANDGFNYWLEGSDIGSGS